MNRRDFLGLGAGAFLSSLRCAEAASFGATPSFATRHLVIVIRGRSARPVDIFGNGNAPLPMALAHEGTLFTGDGGETASLRGHLYTELLTGRAASSQRPRYPTWNEYVRRKTGGKASEFWMLQSVAYDRGWVWDVKHFSTHPGYGARYGATSLTMSKAFGHGKSRSPSEIVAMNLDPGLGHTGRERKQLEDWIADVIATKRYQPSSTREPVIEPRLPLGDCQALELAPYILKTFKPRMLTIQILGLEVARDEQDACDAPTGFRQYGEHLRATDELIGNLWRHVHKDPYLRATTALVIRSEGGRDVAVDRVGGPGHTPGNPSAHSVWTLALGPDFEKGLVVNERVSRLDLAPTLTYLMSGELAEHATGHVRTQVFAERYRMPPYHPS